MWSYEFLRIVWWILLGLLLSGFAIMDGFDLGVAALLPFVAKKDEDRRVVINTVAPVWEANQVWIILGGGVIFAAWPTVYAVSFSSFYLVMLLLLFTFIVRPVGFKYRSKLPSLLWRFTWDRVLCIAGVLAAVIFGAAIGNVLQGIPFYFDGTLRMFYTGQLVSLFNPFAFLCGLVSLAMLVMHGGVYLSLKTSASIQKRALYYSRFSAVVLIVLFVLGGVWIAFGVKGYVLASPINPVGPSNPLLKKVSLKTGAWLFNYIRYPELLISPFLGLLGALGVILLGSLKYLRSAFISSAFSLFGIVTTVGVSMFPFILPSSSNPGSSLLLWDASSSRLTLELMLWVVLIFFPLVLAYISWAFWVLRGRVTVSSIASDDQSY